MDYIRYNSKMDNAVACRYVIVMYYVMEIEQRLFNRLGTTTMFLNLELLNFYYWCNVIFHYV